MDRVDFFYMRSKAKALDSKFFMALCLLFAWITLSFAPAQSSGFALKNSFAGSLTGTFMDASAHSGGNSFKPVALFKESLSKLSFQKNVPSDKFLTVCRGVLPFMAGYSSFRAFASAPIFDFFHFSPPNKASP